MTTASRLLRFLKPFWGWALLSVLLGTATVASGVGLLGTSADLIARAALHPSVAELQVAIVGVRFFGITRAVLRYLERLTSHSVNFRLLANLRVWFYQAVEPLAPARLQQEHSGDLLSRVIGDIETLEDFYVRVVNPPLTALVITTGMALWLGSWDARLGAVLLSGLVLCGFFIPLLIYFTSRAAGSAYVAARAELSAALVDAAQGAADTLAFDQQESTLRRLDNLGQQASLAQRRMSISAGLSAGLTQLVTQLTLVASLWVAVPLVSNGFLSGPQLAVLALAVSASFEAVTPLGTAAQKLEGSLAAARRLFELADAPIPVMDPTEATPVSGSANLEIRDLTFRYHTRAALSLDHISFKVNQGQRIGIVGLSGAGKTTLLNLILRFWDYSQGEICLGSVELHQANQTDIRRCFGVLSQNTYLFAGSIRSNLKLARPDATDNDLWRILEKVRLDTWVKSLPDGLDNWPGERGEQISGGERQRLGLARVLLQDAPIILLDEPTSHLDTITERALVETIINATHNRSVLWISHSLAGMDQMDQVLVMDAGRIIEQGKAAELVKRGGAYSEFILAR